MRGDGRTVTSKVLSLLDAFEGGSAALTLSELAAHADLPLPTAHRLAGRQLRETARPHLQDLFSLTQETAHLNVNPGRLAEEVRAGSSSRRSTRT